MVSFDISRSQWPAKFPFAVAIFTSAFLVFQVQPVVARYILPWFGGTANVWTVCMLFFQIGLLAGYVYAHLLVNYLGSLPNFCAWQFTIAVSFRTSHNTIIC